MPSRTAPGRPCLLEVSVRTAPQSPVSAAGMSQGEDDQVRRQHELLASEQDAAALYLPLADAESGERRRIFQEFAAIERRTRSTGRASCGLRECRSRGLEQDQLTLI